MSGSPEAAIERAQARERLARRQAVGLAALTAVGLILTRWPPADRFGELIVGLGAAFGAIEAAVIVSARGRARRAVDSLIDAGFVVRADSRAADLVAARMHELGDESARRRLATALRDALADAARPRSSNPLVLAERSIVLSRGTALALLAERELVLRIASDLTGLSANPRAVLALRTLLYPQPDGTLSIDDQQREAQRDLHRIAQLLDIHEAGAEADTPKAPHGEAFER